MQLNSEFQTPQYKRPAQKYIHVYKRLTLNTIFYDFMSDGYKTIKSIKKKWVNGSQNTHLNIPPISLNSGKQFLD